MTTDIEQTERPLREVDEVAQRLQAPSPGSDGFGVERVQRATQQAVQRATEDPRSVAFLAVGLIVVILVAALAWGRRSRPRSAEEILLERSREAFDQSRVALEAAIARLGSALER
jgi:hypothetical protein